MGDDGLRLDPERVRWHEIDGEILAVDLADSEYLSLNPTAAVIWRRLAHGTTRAELVEGIAEQFAVDPGTAGADVDAFLDALVARGLLGGGAAEEVEP